ncbi:MAG: hypothetical protein GQ569_02680 [Methylococcaceae bacterium]|nr:hypothetical protein [Methylococcaceae bacterium]
MKLYSKIFVLAFVLDGGISFIDALLDSVDIHSLMMIRSLIANITLLLGLVMYFLISINRQLPKKILLPLILFIFWAALSALPLPVYLDNQNIDVIISFIQLLLGIYAIYWDLKINKGVWQGVDYSFSFKYSGLFLLTNLLLFPVVLSFYLYAALSMSATQETAGFMRLSLDGLYLQERHYQKGEQNIRLVAMIHIGEKEYYEDLSETLIEKNAVILAEGVSDSDQLLKNAFKMDKIADFVGLSSQHEMYLEGNFISSEDLDNKVLESDEKMTDIVRADVDINQLAPETLNFLNTLGEHIANSNSIVEWMLSFYQWSASLPVETMTAINHDIVDKRNQVLLRYLAIALTKYNTVVIPWGALHMPAFEQAVIAQGFSLVDSKERLSIDWVTLDF